MTQFASMRKELKPKLEKTRATRCQATLIHMGMIKAYGVNNYNVAKLKTSNVIRTRQTNCNALMEHNDNNVKPQLVNDLHKRERSKILLK